MTGFAGVGAEACGRTARDLAAAGEKTKGARRMIALLLRDLKLSVRAGGGALIGVLFFMTVVAVIPFGVGPDLNLLVAHRARHPLDRRLLASLLGLDRLFQAEREDGSLDLLLMQETPLVLTVFVKCARPLDGHRPAAGDRLAAARPVHEHGARLAIGAAMLTLLAGTPAITFIGAAGAAVAVAAAARRAAGLHPGAAARHPRADLRRQRRLCGGRGSRPISAALPDSDGDHPVLRRHRARCGRERCALPRSAE